MTSTLHRHIKHKLQGKCIFAKTTDLAELTERLPVLTCTKLQFEKEEGLNKLLVLRQ